VKKETKINIYIYKIKKIKNKKNENSRGGPNGLFLKEK
jgi:hypothetical protein